MDNITKLRVDLNTCDILDRRTHIPTLDEARALKRRRSVHFENDNDLLTLSTEAVH